MIIITWLSLHKVYFLINFHSEVLKVWKFNIWTWGGYKPYYEYFFSNIANIRAWEGFSLFSSANFCALCYYRKSVFCKHCIHSLWLQTLNSPYNIFDMQWLDNRMRFWGHCYSSKNRSQGHCYWLIWVIPLVKGTNSPQENLNIFFSLVGQEFSHSFTWFCFALSIGESGILF